MKNNLFAGSFSALFILGVNAGQVNAADEAGNCTAAKQLVSAASAFHGEQPELTNLIAPQLNIGLKGINGHPDPTHLLYRFEGFEHAMPIEGGQLQGLEAVKGWSTKGKLCSIYEGGPIGDTEEDAVSLSVSFAFPFRRKDGLFSVAEIKEGAKDGSKIIKDLAPTGLGFAAPSLKTLIVSPADKDDDMPRLIFTRKGKPADVKISQYNKLQYIRLKDIKSAKVDRLNIEGPYSASAFFKIDPDVIADREAKRLAASKKETN